MGKGVWEDHILNIIINIPLSIFLLFLISKPFQVTLPGESEVPMFSALPLPHLSHYNAQHTTEDTQLTEQSPKAIGYS